MESTGAKEVMDHPFFSDINWDSLLTDTPPFVPATVKPEDTSYFEGMVMFNISMYSDERVQRGKNIGH